MYSWKDARGVTQFSDQPPPGAAKVQQKPMAQQTPSADLPYGLASAVKNQPVILYTTNACEACDQGRAMLRQRGIPYTEKTVTTGADQNVLRQAGSANELPLLLVGSAKLVGYQRERWDLALTAAAYPLRPALPAGYRNPAPAPAAPPPKTAAPAEAEPADAAAEALRNRLPARDGPPNFQF